MKGMLVFSFLVFVVSEGSTQESLIWEFKGEKSQFFLLGSLHLATKDIYPLDNRIETAFKNSDHLVVEIDSSKINKNISIAWTKKNGLYTGSESIESALTDLQLEKIRRFFLSFGHSWEKLRRSKPWFLATLVPLLQYQKLGLNSEFGIESYFTKLANNQQKRILSLEPQEYFVQKLSSLPEKYHIASIERLLDSPLTEEIVTETIRLWKTNNATEFYNFVFPSDLINVDLNSYEVLYGERNRNWVNRIKELDKVGGSYFIVVGSGHLFGDSSLLKLLSTEGFILSPVK